MFLNDVLDKPWPDKDGPDNPFNYKNYPTHFSLTRLDFNNIADYLSEDEHNMNTITNLGICIPAWDFCWTEYKSKTFSHFLGKIGAVHHTEIIPDPIKIIDTFNITQEKKDYLKNSKLKFYTCSSVFIERTDLNRIILCGEFFSMFDEAGKIIDNFGGTAYYMREDFETGLKFLASMLAPAFFGFSLAHCKNIEIVDVKKDFKKLNKNRKKKNKSPLFEFKVVKLTDASKKVYTIHDLNDSRKKVNFHICRGHFKEYNEEKPLFGKLTGKFWVPQHTRGDIKKGFTKKDYIGVKA